MRLGSFESNRQYHEKMRGLMGRELTFVVEGSDTQRFNVVDILEVSKGTPAKRIIHDEAMSF